MIDDLIQRSYRSNLKAGGSMDQLAVSGHADMKALLR
jgi:hypothetical protein